MLTIEKSKYILKLLIPLFVTVLSFFILSQKVPESRLTQKTVESLDNSKVVVMEFAGATIATSLAISALPDDFATPLADTLADMNKYFVLLMIIIFVEKMVVTYGIKLSFMVIIPVACISYAVATITNKKMFTTFAHKLLILGISIVIAIPLSINISNSISADYLKYVDETIAQTNAGADKVNDVMEGADESQTIFEKLSDAFKTAINGVTDLLHYFNDIVKKCINSIAILIVTTFVIPLLILMFYKWLLGQLFNLNIAVPYVQVIASKETSDDDKNITKGELE